MGCVVWCMLCYLHSLKTRPKYPLQQQMHILEIDVSCLKPVMLEGCTALCHAEDCASALDLPPVLQHVFGVRNYKLCMILSQMVEVDAPVCKLQMKYPQMVALSQCIRLLSAPDVTWYENQSPSSIIQQLQLQHLSRAVDAKGNTEQTLRKYWLCMSNVTLLYWAIQQCEMC
jgi:hypothetical protein